MDEVRIENKPLNPAWYVALTASVILNVVSLGFLYLVYTSAPGEVHGRFDGDCASVEYVDSVARTLKNELRQEIERTRCHCGHRPGFPGAPVGAPEK